jgi:two-component system, response regulator PdtaR
MAEERSAVREKDVLRASKEKANLDLWEPFYSVCVQIIFEAEKLKMAVVDAQELRVFPQAILVVEDEALVRMDTAGSLREGGYFVQEASNANDAINSLQSKPVIDLLFTDINLGKGMNGVDLAEWALRHRPSIAVLVTTGDALSTSLPLALGPILAKPYTAVELLKRVRHALASDDGLSRS